MLGVVNATEMLRDSVPAVKTTYTRGRRGLTKGFQALAAEGGIYSVESTAGSFTEIGVREGEVSGNER